MAQEDRKPRTITRLYFPGPKPTSTVNSMDEHTIDHSMSDSVKLGVLIHRMGTLEAGMGEIGNKIDNMGTLYPTTIHVDLIVAPLREKITKLEENERDREREKDRQTAQLKLAMTVAIFSPIISIIISLLIGNSK